MPPLVERGTWGQDAGEAPSGEVLPSAAATRPQLTFRPRLCADLCLTFPVPSLAGPSSPANPRTLPLPSLLPPNHIICSSAIFPLSSDSHFLGGSTHPRPALPSTPGASSWPRASYSLDRAVLAIVYF